MYVVLDDLWFTTIKYVQAYYKILKFIKTNIYQHIL